VAAGFLTLYAQNMSDVSLPQNEDSMRGFGFALGAYLLWGFLPVYMKALAHVPAVEIIAHRAIWSLPVAGLVLILSRRTADLKRALKTPRMVGMAAMTAALISVNWGIYIWAIASDNALDAALGYYINPLFSIFLGALLLGERLHLLQKLAIGLAAIAVIVLTVQVGRLPFVALSLTVTWGAYAYLKKQLPIGPNQGFFLEVLLLSPFAILWIIWLGWTGQGHFLAGNAMDTALLFGCGLVTAVPLILYANGAKLLRLSTIGIMQYIAPTMIFLTAVFLFNEPFGTVQAIAFAMIWTGLALYSLSMFRNRAG
jgi:chloramphenicol-sensitive protein RarD